VLQSFSLHSNSRLQGEPKLAGVFHAKDDGGDDDNWTTGAISRAKLQSNHHHQQTNIGLAYPKITWGLPTLSLTTNSSWLP